MALINAWELIYCRVEARYSPTDESGQQIVFHSHALTPTECEEIESRVSCFGNERDYMLVRWQFFTLSTRRIVLSRTQLIASDATIIDKASRAGAFLAHCLVFDPKEFQGAPVFGNPFFVMPNFPVIQNAQQLNERYIVQRATHSRTSASIPVTWEMSNSSGWTMQGLNLFYLTENRAPSVSLSGTPAKALEFLEAAFRFAQTATRPSLTFDTFVEGCLSAGNCWASAPQNRGGALDISLTAGHLPSMSVTQERETGLYENWLKQVPSQDAYRLALAAQEITAALADHRLPDQSLLEEEAAESVVAAHKGLVHARVEAVLNKVIRQEGRRETFKRYFYSSGPDYPTIVRLASTESVEELRAYLPSLLRNVAPRISSVSDHDFTDLVMALLILGTRLFPQTFTARLSAFQDAILLKQLKTQVLRAGNVEPAFSQAIVRRLAQITKGSKPLWSVLMVGVLTVVVLLAIAAGLFFWQQLSAPKVNALDLSAVEYGPSDTIKATIIFARPGPYDSVKASLSRDGQPINQPDAVAFDESNPTVGSVAFIPPATGWETGNYTLTLLYQDQALDNGSASFVIGLGNIGPITVHPEGTVDTATPIRPQNTLLIDVELASFRGGVLEAYTVSNNNPDQVTPPILLTDYSREGHVQGALPPPAGGWQLGDYTVVVSYQGVVLAQVPITIEPDIMPTPTEASQG